MQFPGGSTARDSPSSLQQALEEAADDSEEFRNVARFADMIRENVGDIRAAAFLRRMHDVCAKVDEANMMTAYIRPNRGYFKVEVMLDITDLEHNDPETMVARVLPRSMKQMTQKVSAALFV